MAKVLLFNKPYDVLCQFTDQEGRQTLANYINAPEHKDVYAAGRLDRDSEGLLLLTNDGQLQHHIAHPSKKEAKTYWVQVEGEINQDALAQLQNGVELKDGLSKPAIAKKMDEPALWERSQPVRFRKNQATSWLSLTLTEGRNRQVRRMTAAVGFPTLRLIRYAIGEWNLSMLAKRGLFLTPGDYVVKEFPSPTKTSKPRHRHSHKQNGVPNKKLASANKNRHRKTKAKHRS